MKSRDRSILCAELAALLRAGLGWDHALAAVARDLPARSRDRAMRAAGACERGATPAGAGVATGLWDPRDAALIAAGWQSGNVDVVLSRLARWHGVVAACRQKLVARLWMPGCVLLIAAFTAPLPPLLAREIGGLEYFAIAGRSLAAWAVALVLVGQLVRWIVAPRRAAGLSERLRARLPGRWYLDHLRQRDYLFALEAGLAAGLPAAEALELAATTIAHPAAQSRAATAVRNARAGTPLYAALVASGLLVGRADRELLRVTDATGDPAQLLARRVATIDEDAGRYCEVLAEWLPRAFYVGAVTWFVL